MRPRPRHDDGAEDSDLVRALEGMASPRDPRHVAAALSTSWVHVPSLGDASSPWEITDGDGRHVVAYSSATRLRAALGAIVPSTRVSGRALLDGLPTDADVSLDAGTPDALSLPRSVLPLGGTAAQPTG